MPDEVFIKLRPAPIMRKLIVTNEGDFDYIFDVSADGVQRYESRMDTQELPPINFKPLLVKNFPADQISRVLMYAINDYISKNQLEEAWSLTCANQMTLKKCYEQVFCQDHSSVLERIKRLGYVYRWCQFLHDQFLMDQIEDLEKCWVATFEYPKRLYDDIKPWDFPVDSLDIIATDSLTLREPALLPRAMHSYQLGPFHGDLCWVRGKSQKGLMKASRVIHPVALVMFRDIQNRMLQLETAVSRFYFGCLSRFFKRTAGPDAGIFFLVEAVTDPEDVFNARYIICELE